VLEAIARERGLNTGRPEVVVMTDRTADRGARQHAPADVAPELYAVAPSDPSIPAPDAGDGGDER
jgi:hypothetical protein